MPAIEKGLEEEGNAYVTIGVALVPADGCVHVNGCCDTERWTMGHTARKNVWRLPRALNNFY